MAELSDSGVIHCPLNCWKDPELSRLVREVPTQVARDDDIPPPLPTGKCQKSAASQLYGGLPALAPWQTRILRLDPGRLEGQPSTGVVCRLLVADVIHADGLGVHEEDGPRELEYEALSYCWGEAVFPQTITVNNVAYPVTNNLFLALKMLRSDDSSRYVWVDALCINQYNNAEKSIQVRRMRWIYQKASRVIAWDGNWNNDRCRVLNHIRKLEFWREFQARARNTGVHSLKCVEVCYEFLSTILRLPLFRRVWIRQEVFAARELTLQLGSVTLNPGEVVRLCERMGKVCPEIVQSFKSVPTDIYSLRSPRYAAELVSSRRRSYDVPAYPSPEPSSFASALFNTPFFEASDPRDFVYGAIGCTNILSDTPDQRAHTSAAVMTIDYSLTLSEVFQASVRYIIEASSSLNILYFCDCRPQDCGFPSWTLDWRCVRRLLPFTTRDSASHAGGQAENPVLGSDKWRSRFCWSLGGETEFGSRHMTYNKLPTWLRDPLPRQVEAAPSSESVALDVCGVIIATVDDTIPDEEAWCLYVPNELASSRKSVRHVTRRAYLDKCMSKLRRSSPTQGLVPRKIRVAAVGNQLLNGQYQVAKEVSKKATTGHRPVLHQVEAVALVPMTTRNGDRLVLLRGSRFPFVLRPGIEERYTLVGMAVYPIHFYQSVFQMVEDLLAWLDWTKLGSCHPKIWNRAMEEYVLPLLPQIETRFSIV